MSNNIFQNIYNLILEKYAFINDLQTAFGKWTHKTDQKTTFSADMLSLSKDALFFV